MLNTLSLRPYQHDSRSNIVLDIYIDDVRFLDRLTEFEQRFDEQGCGYKPSLGQDAVHRGMVLWDFWFMPFVCLCGDSDCGSFAVQVKKQDEEVSWHGWRCAPWSYYEDERFRDYSDLPVLRFDKKQYLAEIKAAKALLAPIHNPSS